MPTPKPVLRIIITTRDGDLLEEFWTDEELRDVRIALNKNVSLYDSEEELEQANREMSP